MIMVIVSEHPVCLSACHYNIHSAVQTSAAQP